MARLLSRRLAGIALVIAAACAGSLAAGAYEAQRGPAAAADGSAPSVATVRPLVAAPGRRVRAGFVGLSIEWPVLMADLGPRGVPPPALVDALRLLRRPPLRIGGDSQDRTWPWAQRLPAGAFWAPAPAFWTGLGRLAAAAGTIEVGLDLAHDDPLATRAMAEAALRALPPGRVAFSLGNEPDRYAVQPWARRRNGTMATARGRAWSSAAYERQYAVVRGVLGTDTLDGPDFADPRWRGALPAFIRLQRPRAVNIHAYPLNVCGKHRGGHGWPTSRKLLARASWAGIFDARFRWAVQDAASAHVPLVVSEANSVACRGARGVSDGPAAALWAPAYLLSAARAGVAQVNLHASGSVYDPFWIRRGTDAVAQAEPSALFDGLRFTQRVLEPGARVFPVVTTPQRFPAWASRTPDGRVQVLLENLHPAEREVAEVVLPRARGTATVARLLRAGRDRAGHARMSIDGQVVVGRAGRLVEEGARHVAWAPIIRGRVRVTLAPMSAAIVSARAG